MKPWHVAVLMGGPSAEREVSLKSGAMVAQYLDWTASEVGRASRRGETLVGKRASHLVRILIELRGALVAGRLDVRPHGADRKLILAVRSGDTDGSPPIARLHGECLALAERARWRDPDPAPIEAIVLRARLDAIPSR